MNFVNNKSCQVVDHEINRVFFSREKRRYRNTPERKDRSNTLIFAALHKHPTNALTPILLTMMSAHAQTGSMVAHVLKAIPRGTGRCRCNSDAAFNAMLYLALFGRYRRKRRISCIKFPAPEMCPKQTVYSTLQSFSTFVWFFLRLRKTSNVYLDELTNCRTCRRVNTV